MTPGATVMVERDAEGDEEDHPLKLKIVKPRKRPAKKAEPEKVGVGAKKGDDDDAAGRAAIPNPQATTPPSNKAIGTWSGGRFLRFGEAIEPERLEALLRPGDGIDAVLSADVYGTGDADSLLGRALHGIAREDYSLIGAVGHDFYEGERAGPKGFPRFTDPALRPAGEYAGYLRMATERSLERLGQDRFDLLLLHNPDRTGYESEKVWDGMAALREAGLADAIGVAPGPANGFTLDLVRCFERFGDRIDWAMVILNPFEPWPGELCLDAAARHDVRVITRVVDYGGIFWDDVTPETELPQGDHRSFRPQGWIAEGRAKLDRLRPVAESVGAHSHAARLPVEPRPPGGRVRRPDSDPGGGRERPADRGEASGACLSPGRGQAEPRSGG